MFPRLRPAGPYEYAGSSNSTSCSRTFGAFNSGGAHSTDRMGFADRYRQFVKAVTFGVGAAVLSTSKVTTPRARVYLRRGDGVMGAGRQEEKPSGTGRAVG